MNHRRIFFQAMFLITMLIPAVVGCTQATPIQVADTDAVLAYTEPKADDLLAGLNNNDYATFSKHFDEKMGTAMTDASLTDIQDQIIGKVGKYVSRTVASVEESGPYMTVIYNAKFELEDPVTIRLVFEKEGEHRISGLWFDSPKLREK